MTPPSKRKLTGGTPPLRAPCRIKPVPTTTNDLRVVNLDNGETVHQQCLLLAGECPTFDNSDDDYISVKTSDSLQSVNASQNWPVCKGKWKALVLLVSGTNNITVDLHHAGGVFTSVQIRANYQPLTQLPPLHLAVLVARDSPLLIDCPPTKYGAFSSAHSSLDAAIAKFRMTALMWQALTAEDMRAKGFGRRSFRFEEEWGLNTSTMQARSSNAFGRVVKMSSVPKVHIVRTEKTVAELKKLTPGARGPTTLHRAFEAALENHGSPFISSSLPVVAGLILDAHLSVGENRVYNHTAAAIHDRTGLSLATFGSHLCFSWPRFLDEVSDVLEDQTLTRQDIETTHDQMNQICATSQADFLHQIGLALGGEDPSALVSAPESQEYRSQWSKVFLASEEDDHTCRWSLQSALRFKNLQHFRMPGDEILSDELLSAPIHIEGDDLEEQRQIKISCATGIAAIDMTDGKSSKHHSLMEMKCCSMWGTTELSSFDPNRALEITALAKNGQSVTTKNGWKLFQNKSYITVPGTGVRLQKISVRSKKIDDMSGAPDGYAALEEMFVNWTVLLSKRNLEQNRILPVCNIQLRVGCSFDGAYVQYGKGNQANCGPVKCPDGREFHFGGSAYLSPSLSKDTFITKVEISKTRWGHLDGIKMRTNDGQHFGELNNGGWRQGEGTVETLQPAPGQKIFGFFGRSHKPFEGHTEEFGIITAPSDWDVPESIYDLPELMNEAEVSFADGNKAEAEMVEDKEHEDDAGVGEDDGSQITLR